MTEAEVMAVIDKVVNKTAPKYTFYGYEVDDMKQESYIECLEALERFKPGIAPLENFLSNNLSKRLLNVIRKHHFKKSDKEDKKRVLMPGQLSNEESMRYYEDRSSENLYLSELAATVEANLPHYHRENYLKLINDVHVDKKQKDELIEVIKTIIEENGYDGE